MHFYNAVYFGHEFTTVWVFMSPQSKRRLEMVTKPFRTIFFEFRKLHKVEKLVWKNLRFKFFKMFTNLKSLFFVFFKFLSVVKFISCYM